MLQLRGAEGSGSRSLHCCTRCHKITPEPVGSLSQVEAKRSCRSSSTSLCLHRELQPALQHSPAGRTPLERSGVDFSCPPTGFRTYPTLGQITPWSAAERCQLLAARPKQRVKWSSPSSAEVRQQDTKEKGGQKFMLRI